MKFEQDVGRIQLQRQVDDSYDIVVGWRLFDRIATDLREMNLGSKYAIITDSNVYRYWAAELDACLSGAGLETKIFQFPAGEQSKTPATCIDIMGEMSKARFGRDSVVLALGGGVVGDMAGFIAAIFKRGVPYVQIPTTLLAQADSSIGGKTAVDTEQGKNLVGAFKQPKVVYIDVHPLSTLPVKELRNGLAETIKHGIIQDEAFFEFIKDSLEGILRRDIEVLKYLAKKNCFIKGTVVEQDPNENGLRRILNYGHTIGHALEKLSDYRLSHGEAVSIGMMVAGRIALALGNDFPLARQEQLLLRAGLPTKILPSIAGFSDEDIVRATLTDKKAKDGRARYVLPVAIGRMREFGGEYAIPVKGEVVMQALKETRE